MEKYTVPVTPVHENPKHVTRPRWKRSLIELNGKFEPTYRHDISALLMQSYSEIGSFAHSYHIGGVPCQTHVNWITNVGYMGTSFGFRQLGVSALEFDTKITYNLLDQKSVKYLSTGHPTQSANSPWPCDANDNTDGFLCGIYLASVTKSGCLTVHDFESLYCQASKSLRCLKEDEAKHLLHISTSHQIDAVRWNLANQDEVACTSMSNNEVHIFDIGYISSEPVEVLRKRPTVTVHGCDVRRGLSDVAFPSNDNSRVLASDTCGAINIWDRRVNNLPNVGLTTNSNSTLNSIQLNVENQIVYGASKSGIIYMWDLRGGRSSAAFQSHKEAHSSPMTSVKLASVLNNIGPLKAQSNIVSKEIHSIGINPSCAYQLAFHLDDGWSGVLDIHNFRVTHIHCPPPAWLDDSTDSASLSYLRKPSWLPTHSIYAVGSSSNNGIHLLDFYPDHSSPCHVDYNDDINSPEEAFHHKQNKFLPLSERVTACATHPLNGSIIAGTKQSSLLMISQKRLSCQSGDNC